MAPLLQAPRSVYAEELHGRFRECELCKHSGGAFRTLAGDHLVAFRRRDAIEAGLAKPQTDSSGSHKKVARTSLINT